MTKHRYILNMTCRGGELGFDCGGLGARLEAADGALPAMLDVTALRARKDNGSFQTLEELACTGEQAVNQTVSLNASQFIGVIRLKGDSKGQVAEVQADNAGQILMFSLNLPM